MAERVGFEPAWSAARARAALLIVFGEWDITVRPDLNRDYVGRWFTTPPIKFLLKGWARLADDGSVSLKNNARLVYSTDRPASVPSAAGRSEIVSAAAAERPATRFRRASSRSCSMEKKGRGGKTVTVVYGLPRTTSS